jgi:hypothetical protein
MGDSRSVYKVFVENLNGRDNVEELGIDGKTVLKCTSRNRTGV